jgi:hypothetical protein
MSETETAEYWQKKTVVMIKKEVRIWRANRRHETSKKQKKKEKKKKRKKKPNKKSSCRVFGDPQFAVRASTGSGRGVEDVQWYF